MTRGADEDFYENEGSQYSINSLESCAYDEELNERSEEQCPRQEIEVIKFN